MSTQIDSALRPNSAPRRASEMTFAEWMMFLLGRQATLGHAPPSAPRSINAVRRPAPAMVHAINFPAPPLPIARFSYLSGFAIGLVSFRRFLVRFGLRKVDWNARDVAHVILEDIQRYVSDGLDDFAVAQIGRTRAREIRVRDFSALNDDAARKFEDGIGSRVGRARANCIVDFNLTQPDLRGHSRVPAQAVSAKVALGDRERELLASFFVEGSASEGRTQTHQSLERRRRIRKHAKQVRHHREFRAYLCEESPNRAGCTIRIDWLDAILVSGSAHRRLSAECSRSTTAFVPSSAMRESASTRSVPGG